MPRSEFEANANGFRFAQRNYTPMPAPRFVWARCALLVAVCAAIGAMLALAV